MKSNKVQAFVDDMQDLANENKLAENEMLSIILGHRSMLATAICSMPKAEFIELTDWFVITAKSVQLDKVECLNAQNMLRVIAVHRDGIHLAISLIKSGNQVLSAFCATMAAVTIALRHQEAE